MSIKDKKKLKNQAAWNEKRKLGKEAASENPKFRKDKQKI